MYKWVVICEDGVIARFARYKFALGFAKKHAKVCDGCVIVCKIFDTLNSDPRPED